MIVRYLVTETLKLRRSLVLMLALTAPLLVVIMCVVIGLHSKASAIPMRNYEMTGAAFWAFAMLPLSVTALSVLLSQMEHGARSWDHLLTLPGARPRIFLAKALVLFAIVSVMTGWMGFLLFGGAQFLGMVKSLDAPFEVSEIAGTLGRMLLASMLMIVLQLWVALRTRSFVPPLVLGIIGTFISVVAASAREGAYFPDHAPPRSLNRYGPCGTGGMVRRPRRRSRACRYAD